MRNKLEATQHLLFALLPAHSGQGWATEGSRLCPGLGDTVWEAEGGGHGGLGDRPSGVMAAKMRGLASTGAGGGGREWVEVDLRRVSGDPGPGEGRLAQNPHLPITRVFVSIK